MNLIVQHDIERYQEIAEQPGDSFYVRAQFDKLAFDSHEQMELCFRRDDILHIDNTMFNGVPGLTFFQIITLCKRGEKKQSKVVMLTCCHLCF